ncbi:MAG: DUF1841 family protein [Acidiferrobacterales bacterium]
MLFAGSRQESRQIFFSAWRKYLDKKQLEGVEGVIVQVALQHPEYHNLLEQPDQFADKDYLPEHGATNPFLHMGMHVTIEEQLGMDRPLGIKSRFEALAKKRGDAHEAQHIIMECLAEMLWQAQRQGSAPDEDSYLSCIDINPGTSAR